MSLIAMSRQQADQILWELPDPLLALSRNRHIEYINSAFEKMLGVLLGQIKGKTIHEADLEKGDDWKRLLQKRWRPHKRVQPS